MNEIGSQELPDTLSMKRLKMQWETSHLLVTRKDAGTWNECFITKSQHGCNGKKTDVNRFAHTKLGKEPGVCILRENQYSKDHGREM